MTVIVVIVFTLFCILVAFLFDKSAKVHKYEIELQKMHKNVLKLENLFSDLSENEEEGKEPLILEDEGVVPFATYTTEPLHVRAEPNANSAHSSYLETGSRVTVFSIHIADDGGVWGKIFGGYINLKHTTFKE